MSGAREKTRLIFFPLLQRFELMLFFFFLIRNVCTVNYPSASCGGSGRCFHQKAEMDQLSLDRKHEPDVILRPSKY